MTAPLHSRDVPGKGRYYGACSDTCPLGTDGPLYMSVTNAQSVVNKPALPPAAARDTAQAAWDRLPQMVATSREPEAGIPADGGKPCKGRSPVSTRCGRCRFCITMAIKAEYKLQWESKADFGTLVHVHAAAHVLGEPMPYDEQVAPFIDQYLRFLDEWGVDLATDVVAAETTVFDRKHRYAGTGDVWIQLRDFGRNGGKGLVLVDLKTSLTKPVNTVYVDQKLQLAGLRYAPTAVLVDDSEVKVPAFAATALLNLRANDYALIPVPTDKAAHGAFLSAVTLQRDLHESDPKLWVPASAPSRTAVA
jgi:hypothetical protein